MQKSSKNIIIKYNNWEAIFASAKRMEFNAFNTGRITGKVKTYADNYMLIHCTYIYSKKERSKSYGSILIEDAEKEVKPQGMDGLCVITSKGGWFADKNIFEKYGFTEADRRGRFELLFKIWDKNYENPKLFDWTKQQKKYKGWHLL